jgi:hypothetical protein
MVNLASMVAQRVAVINKINKKTKMLIAWVNHFQAICSGENEGFCLSADSIIQESFELWLKEYKKGGIR